MAVSQVPFAERVRPVRSDNGTAMKVRRRFAFTRRENLLYSAHFNRPIFLASIFKSQDQPSPQGRCTDFVLYRGTWFVSQYLGLSRPSLSTKVESPGLLRHLGQGLTMRVRSSLTTVFPFPRVLELDDCGDDTDTGSSLILSLPSSFIGSSESTVVGVAVASLEGSTRRRPRSGAARRSRCFTRGSASGCFSPTGSRGRGCSTVASVAPSTLRSIGVL